MSDRKIPLIGIALAVVVVVVVVFWYSNQSKWQQNSPVPIAEIIEEVEAGVVESLPADIPMYEGGIVERSYHKEAPVDLAGYEVLWHTSDTVYEAISVYLNQLTAAGWDADLETLQDTPEVQEQFFAATKDGLLIHITIEREEENDYTEVYVEVPLQ